MRGKSTLAFLAVSFLIVAAGCPTTAGPRLIDPGTSEAKRQRALRFDPFADNTMGPAIPDARPRDFQNPPPNSTRGRWDQFGRPVYGDAPETSSRYRPRGNGF